MLAAGNELLEECVACGGSVTAEHGIGVEKLHFMSRLFAPSDLEAMARVHRAMNVAGRLSPGKLLPEVPEIQASGSPSHDSSSQPSSAGRGSPAVPILPLSGTVTPSDPDAVTDAIRQASEGGAPVYPFGGGTSLTLGATPSKPGLGLSLANLNRLVDYPVRDLTITVEAGMTMAALKKHLAAEGQRLPIDVPQPERATIGGVIATNPIGARRFRWGTIRDYLLGFRAVDGCGMVFSGGGRVVKNAAGYNMSRLMTGSLGTLGVLTQVTLMVKPKPETSAFVVGEVADLALAERLLAELVQTKTLPAAIEWLLGPAAQEAQPFWSESSSAAGRVVVGFEGTQPEVDWMVSELQEHWQRLGVSSSLAMRGAEAEPLWTWLSERPLAAAHANGATPLVAEVRVLPGALVETVRSLLVADNACSIQAHAGDGILRVQFSLPAEKAAAVLSQQIRPVVAASGGSAVVWTCPGDLSLKPEAVWGPLGEAAEVMRAIKRQFDPKGILNPGRFCC